jgi:hypothetical protein
MAALRVIRRVHALPGRLRVRLPWLSSARAEAAAVADRLAGLAGMEEVQVRPRTGSVLCRYDPDALDEERILAEIRRATAVAVVLQPGQPVPTDALPARRPAGESSVARALEDAARGINREVYHATEGRLDLGTLAGLGFIVAGAAEILAARRLPAPPWFNLGWMALRTFTMFEHPHAAPETETASPPSSPTPPDVGRAPRRPARRP